MRPFLCSDGEDQSATRVRKLRVRSLHVDLGGNSCQRTCIIGNQLNAGISAVAGGTGGQSARARSWTTSRETRGNDISSSSRRPARRRRVDAISVPVRTTSQFELLSLALAAARNYATLGVISLFGPVFR